MYSIRSGGLNMDCCSDSPCSPSPFAFLLMPLKETSFPFARYSSTLGRCTAAQQSAQNSLMELLDIKSTLSSSFNPLDLSSSSTLSCCRAQLSHRISACSTARASAHLAASSMPRATAKLLLLSASCASSREMASVSGSRSPLYREIVSSRDWTWIVRRALRWASREGGRSPLHVGPVVARSQQDGSGCRFSEVVAASKNDISKEGGTAVMVKVADNWARRSRRNSKFLLRRSDGVTVAVALLYLASS